MRARAVPLGSASARETDRRPLWIGLSAILVVIGCWEFVQLWQMIDVQRSIGIDQAYYVGVARQFLTTGTFYFDYQLQGHYQTTTLVTNLYPPIALYLFVPFVYLPAIFWWILPIGFVGWAIWRLGPVAWGWPILAAMVVFPKTISAAIYGNSDIWITAFVAGAVLWGWPAVLIAMKPSLAFFGLIGIRRRSWWIAAAVVAIASVPLLPLWLQWPTVMRNSSSTFDYSLGNLPMTALPFVAWLLVPRQLDWIRARLPRR